MTFLFNDNARMALDGIRGNKTRSLLTMLGIIIGVASVILTVAMGEGIRRQVVETNQGNNDSLVTVRSGNIATRDKSGKIIEVNYMAALGVNSLTERDYEAMTKLSDAGVVVPLATISGATSNFDDEVYKDVTVIATNQHLPTLLDQEVAYGNFFNDKGSGRNIVVIGKRVAEQLFKENVPLGKLITIRGEDYVVGGVFEEFRTNPLSSVTDLNKAVFMSYPTAKTLAGSSPNIYQIMALPHEGVSTAAFSKEVSALLLKNHGGQEDFTVLKGNEISEVARQTVSVATSFVAGIAAISLLVGGIGIMNIMFVSVTERTREIGVRKSLGATNRQIYSQFLIEAAAVSIIGGIIGVVVAYAGDILIRFSTDLAPAITFEIIAMAVGVSAVVGVVFGTIPAVKAARKDPIESLRYE